MRVNSHTRATVGGVTALATLAAAFPALPAQAAARCLTNTQIDAAVATAVSADTAVKNAQKALVASRLASGKAVSAEATALAAYKKAQKSKSKTDDAPAKVKYDKAVATRKSAAAAESAAQLRLDTVTVQAQNKARAALLAAQRCASSSITLAGTAGNDQVSLDWNAATGATLYTILRDGVSIGTTDLLNFVDSTAQNGVTYSYQIQSDALGVGAGKPTLSKSSTPIWAASDDEDEDEDEHEGHDGDDEGDDDGDDEGDDDHGGGVRGLITSNTVTATPAIPAPTDLLADSTNGQVSLSWTAVPNATGYQVLRDGVVIASTDTNSYSDVFASVATYTVRALDGTAVSVDSASAAVSASFGAPLGVAATPGDRQVVVTWQSVTGATSYQVLRDGSVVGTPSGLTYTDTGLANGVAYTYTVRAVKGVDISVDSATATATPAAAVVVPAAPSGLAASAGNAEVVLTWTAVTGADSYEVWRNGVKVGSPTAATYTDSGLTNGMTYTYYVKTVKGGVSSANSSNVTGSPVAPIVQLAAPTGVSAGTATSLNTGAFRLTWNAVTGATGYEIYRGGVLLGTSTTTNYTPTSVPAVASSYQVKATNASPAATSDFSAAITAGVWSGAAANDSLGRNTYGQIAVSIVTVGTTVTGCWATYPTTSDSGSINRNAIPALCSQVLAKQPKATTTALITNISGASATSPAFRTSLASALTKAGL